MQLNEVPLSWLPVTVVDCQATGASPKSGRLLELAWWVSGSDKVHVHLVALPEGERVPPRITLVTGIKGHHLTGAPPAARVWRRFLDALPHGFGAVPVVAHFARYERAFLEDMRRKQDASPAPELDFICTHEVARRLEPDLPRRGLRALAGFHGHHLGPHRRAAPHVEATRVIWREQVARLNGRGVRTLGDLRAWLADAAPRHGGPWAFPLPREQRLALPNSPGVYRMRGRGGQLLYVGKATSLHSRVNSYFQKRRHGTRETLELLTQVFSVEHTVTPTALEAALLEADLIKLHRPPYNTALKPRQAEESTWFCAPGLDAISPIRDQVCSLGPLPGEQAARIMLVMGRLISMGLSPADNHRRLLGLPDDASRLTRDTLVQGAVLFRQRHGLRPGQQVPGVLLLRLGATLLRRRWAEEAARTQEESLDQEDKPARDRDLPWDAEQVANLLESTTANSARLIRRGRWLSQLASSTMAWSGQGEEEGRMHLLSLSLGQVTARQDLPAGAPLPAPGRQGPGDIDLATHDRLRVLTTELRRLLAAGRSPRVVLQGGRRLEANALTARLRWL